MLLPIWSGYWDNPEIKDMIVPVMLCPCLCINGAMVGPYYIYHYIRPLPALSFDDV